MKKNLKMRKKIITKKNIISREELNKEVKLLRIKLKNLNKKKIIS